MIVNQKLWQHVLIGMIAGLGVGLAFSPMGAAIVPEELARSIGSWFAVIGVVFLGLIGMVILPLVVCSIILGINSSQDALFVKRIGSRLVPYFLITGLIAVLIGVGLAELIQPGKMVSAEQANATIQSAEKVIERISNDTSIENLTIPMRIANIIPSNPLKAALNLDLLQIVIASILVGLAILNLPRASTKSFLEICDAGQLICMKIIEWVMQIAPYAVFGLIADLAIRLGPEAFIGLGWYVLTVLLGLLAIMIGYLLIVAIWARRSPWQFLISIRAVMLLAFSTSSSAAVMPVTMQVTEEKLGIHPDTTRFVIPLGATINMDGTGMYQAAAAIFLCQFFGIELDVVQMILLSLTMVGASIGTPSTPGVGIVILATIVAGLGVPPEGIAMILGVDRVLDMCRTTINVAGDMVAATVMERWLQDDEKKDEKTA